ncbi:TVP38/TMEM64 family protein [Hoyosella subflava]|nr:TVP38/TMEM64 family protein [Hoyosella subflava]
MTTDPPIAPPNASRGIRRAASVVAESLTAVASKTARSARSLSRTRLLGALMLIVTCAAVLVWVPIPTVTELREWAAEFGPIFPILFFVANVLVTLFPIPRTMFTVTGGLLFGVLPGIMIAIGAGTLSAVIALLLVRVLGRDFVHARITAPTFHEVNARLARRGWLAVASLRLIAPIPFSVVNYCCALSSVRVFPFAVATFFGMMPGTVGVILLADAVTGETDPRLALLSGALLGIGVIGLIADSKLGAREALHLQPHDPVADAAH